MRTAGRWRWVLVAALALTLLPPAPGAPASPDRAEATDTTVSLPTAAAAAAQPLRPAVVSADFPDPTIVWGGDAFYAYATQVGAMNVPMIRSRNLYDWSNPVDAVPILPGWAKPGATWAPAVVALGGQYVMYISAIHVFTGQHCIDRIVSPSPSGPFVPPPNLPGPMFCNQVGGTGAIDPSPVVEPDGRVFLDFKAEGSRTLQVWAIELTPDGLQLVGLARHLLTATAAWEGGGVENPAMVLAGGRHYLFYSGNYWATGSYAVGYAICDGPMGPCHKQTTGGPWVSSANAVSGPGASSFARGPDGQIWMAVHGWTPSAVGYRRNGRRQLYVEPVDFSGGSPSLVNRVPDGGFEVASRGPGGVVVGGWAVDPDTGAPVTVNVQLNGRDVLNTVGARNRPDIGQARPQAGPQHGYSATLGVAEGVHQVCVTALDDLGGASNPLGCAEVEVHTAPYGAFEGLVAVAGGMQAAGWAIDPDTAAPIDVHVYVDRRFFGIALANGNRPDISSANPFYGPAHGWTAGIAIGPGIHLVCAYAADTGDEPSVPLGCLRAQVR